MILRFSSVSLWLCKLFMQLRHIRSSMLPGVYDPSQWLGGLHTAAHLDYLSPLRDSLVHLQDGELLAILGQVVDVAVVQGHLEILVKQEMLQVAVHIRVHLFPSYLAWTKSPVDLRPYWKLLTWKLLLNKNSCRWLCTYMYNYFQGTWPEQVLL